MNGNVGYHAWFSHKQAQVVSHIQKIRLSNGQETEATTIAQSNDHGCHYDDMQYLGQIISHISSVPNPRRSHV